jgi:uncharacterized protein YcfL
LKKTIYLVIAAVLVLMVLAGCGTPEAATVTVSQTATQTATQTIASTVTATTTATIEATTSTTTT